MPRIQIKDRTARRVLYESEAEDMQTALQEAVAAGVDLRGANLGGMNLGGANLRGANLGGADLEGAYLVMADLDGAYLSEANLRKATLVKAYLVGAHLLGANLGGANLDGADFVGAYLAGARLVGAKINWRSRDLIAEILRRAADGDVEKLKVVGLILVCREWCWEDFLRLDDPLKPWALETLAGHVQAGDGAPAVLRRRTSVRKKI